VTWGFVVALAAGAYALKVVGMVVLGGRTLPAPLLRCLGLIPAAMISALVVKDTLSTGTDLVLDARAAGVAAAVAAAWLRAPLVVVIVLGAGVTAAVRAVAG
jgi:branched-subunit amino acid transport protein